MNNQQHYYHCKLQYETDSADIYNGIINKEKLRIIDTRSPDAYAMEHIPGAINIWHREMTAEKTRELDTSYTYITYCDGIGCNASTKGALRMSKLGFTVKELLGGLDWWKRDGYATAGTHSNKEKAVSCGC